MLGYNKNYITLSFNCTLENSKKMILALESRRRGGKNNIKEDYNT